jgi:uncharacterized integral membrane protein (TIGR00698 family)
MSSLVLTAGALRARVPRPAPGLAIVALLVACAFACSSIVPAASPLLWAMALGVPAGAWARSRPASAPGVAVAAKHLLRVGVALLGLRISVGDLAEVGLGGVGVAAGTIAVTLPATRWLGRRLRVPADLALLIGTGSAICGASAIAAMDAVVKAREEDVGYAVATVTVFGTAAMLLLPVAAALLGLGDVQAGQWAGASVHEVAQVTAAGAVISTAALKVATLVKLCRVVLLAPTVALVAGRGERPARRGARVPGFVLAFLALVAVRSLLPVPAVALDAGGVVSTVLLAGGPAALGMGVRPRALHGAGARPLLLGLAAWGIAATTALALVLAVG